MYLTSLQLVLNQITKNGWKLVYVHNSVDKTTTETRHPWHSQAISSDCSDLMHACSYWSGFWHFFNSFTGSQHHHHQKKLNQVWLALSYDLCTNIWTFWMLVSVNGICGIIAKCGSYIMLYTACLPIAFDQMWASDMICTLSLKINFRLQFFTVTFSYHEIFEFASLMAASSTGLLWDQLAQANHHQQQSLNYHK